jgi:hypothetical protein
MNLNIAIEGKKNLLKAFSEELDVLEIKPNIVAGDINWVTTITHIIVHHDYGFHNHSGNNKIYSLPEQWNEALEAIKEEMKPKIPEYVKVEPGYFVEKEMEGKILKTSEPFPSHLAHCNKYTWKSVWELNSQYFSPSTKEAWEEQENKPKLSVGDFYMFYRELRYIWKIDNKGYYFKDEINNMDGVNNIKRVDKEGIYKKVSDEKALELLKEYYAKEGIVMGAKMKNLSDNCVGVIKDFKLRKYVDLFKHSDVTIGESQLAYQLDGRTWYTADSNWKVVEESKLFGYDVEIDGNLIKVGCQTYTKNTVELLLDIANGYSDKTVSWYSKILDNTANVTSGQLKELLKLFND